MADPERYDADPDPTYQADADLGPKIVKLKGEKKNFLPNLFFSSPYLTKLVVCNFLSS